MRKRAFTLIELLVVIAIIAILAAILFPVFAQAKVAAKGAASLSNIKQHGTAWIMYAGDYDDRAVPVWARTPGPLYLAALPNTPYSPWSQLLQPYQKSSALSQDPLVQPNATEGTPPIPVNLLWPYRPQYGYAFTVWSPIMDLSIDGRPQPVSLTEAADPSRTVVFTQRKNRQTLDWIFTGTMIWMAQSVAPPYCTSTSSTARTGVNPDSMCAINFRWGVGGMGALSPMPTDIEGARTGCVSLRKTMMALSLFSDSSAKFLPPAKLAAGTNWNWTRPSSQITMVDRSQYLWDLD